jgi:hypothetical protein
MYPASRIIFSGKIKKPLSEEERGFLMAAF